MEHGRLSIGDSNERSRDYARSEAAKERPGQTGDEFLGRAEGLNAISIMRARLSRIGA